MTRDDTVRANTFLQLDKKSKVGSNFTGTKYRELREFVVKPRNCGQTANLHLFGKLPGH